MSRARLAVAAVVVVALAWGHTGALSMVLSLSVRTTARSSRYSIVDVLRQTQQPLPQPQSPLSLRREVVPVAYSRARGRRAWTMATTSSRSAVILEDRSEGCQRDTPVASQDVPPPPTPNGATDAAAVAGSSMLARVVPSKEPWLTEAGARLREGKLVAFPTETVYGLGANALSETAVLQIFQAKQRPLTDPLIVHVPDTASALAVVDFESEGGGGLRARRLFTLLGEKLWPGPLTLILKAAKGVPSCVTAETGFVGVRCPAHPGTLKLLSLAGVPVAAPSANRFGHVSPTQAVHVMEDLGASDILVLDGDESGACGVGIESTVAKIDVANERILILRMGGVTQDRLRGALNEGGEEFAGISVCAGSVAGGKAVVKSKVDEVEEASEGGESTEAEGQAPGQLLRHYSPDLEVFRVVGVTAAGSDGRIGNNGEGDGLKEMARTSVVIDFAGQLKGLEAVALAYLDLSVNGDVEGAATGLFRALRWAEGQPSAQRLLIVDLPSCTSGDLAAAVNDRIYRAASGKTIPAE